MCLILAGCFIKVKKEGEKMKIDKAAIAGTLESSDCMVTVEPGNGSVELELESVVMNQFGEQIQKVVRETWSAWM